MPRLPTPHDGMLFITGQANAQGSCFVPEIQVSSDIRTDMKGEGMGWPTACTLTPLAISKSCPVTVNVVYVQAQLVRE
jgi:hypothetical protein